MDKKKIKIHTKKTIDNFNDLKYAYKIDGRPYSLRIDDFKRTSRFILNPDFQRVYCWSIPKASALIESILLSLPIPSIYSYCELGTGKELIIDGQQRLTTIKNFLNNGFKLQGLNILKNLEGLEFYQLEQEYRDRILTYNLQVYCLDNISNNKIIYDIFQRFNTGGLKLNAQEIRNCIYNGKYNSYIKKVLAKDEKLMKLLEKFKPKRYFAEELVVRFLALYDGLDSYKGNMNNFLNNHYEERMFLNTFSEADFKNYINERDKVFRNSVCACEIVFGHNAFKNLDKYETPINGKMYGFGSFSKFAFDMQMIGFADIELSKINRYADKIREKYIEILLKYPEMEPVSKNNNKLTAKRIRKWQDCIGKIINE